MPKIWVYYHGTLRSVDASRVRIESDGFARLLLSGTWEEYGSDGGINRFGRLTKCRSKTTGCAYGDTVSECLERANRWVYERVDNLDREREELLSRLVTEESIAAKKAQKGGLQDDSHSPRPSRDHATGRAGGEPTPETQ